MRAHLSISSRINAANASGVLDSGSMPSASSCVRTAVSAALATTAAWMVLTTLRGVAAGATSPSQFATS